MPNFATTPISTTTLSANQFPVSAVFVPGTASGNLTALQGGPASTDGNGYVSAPVAVYQATGTNLHVVVDSGTITDSGTVTANAGSGTFTVGQATGANLHTVVDSGTVSVTALPAGANTIGNVGIVAGSALIGGVELVDSGGTNKAAISAAGAVKVDGSAITQPVSGTVTADQGGSWTVTANAGTNLNTSALALDTSVNGLLLAQGSTTSGEKGPLVQGTVTTSAPTYTTGQTNPLSLTTAGALRVDGSGATQPVSGTVTANIGTTNGLALDATVAKLNVAQAAALGSNTGPMMQGSVTTNAPSYITGNINPLSLDTSGLLRASLKDTPSNTNNFNVNLAASAATVTVSASGNFNNASVGSTGSAVPASGTYMTANKAGNLTGLSLDGSGNLNVNVAAGGASGGTSSSFGLAFPSTGTAIGASDGANMQSLLVESSSNKNLRVALYNGSTEATVTAGNALKVDGSAVTQPVSGTVSITANSAVNVAQFGGTNVVTGTGASGSGIPRVTVSNDSNVLTTQSGTWTVQPGNTQNTTPWLVAPQVASSGGSVPYHNLTANSTNFTNVKGAACQLYGYEISNISGSAIYVKFYDKATAPGTTDTPKRTIQVPANGTVIRAYPVGLKFSSGFGWGATGASLDNDATAISANCVVDFDLNA